MKSGHFPGLAIAAVICTALVLNSIVSQTFQEIPPLPQGEADFDGANPLVPANVVPRSQIDAVVKKFSDEGDRLVGLGQFQQAIVIYSSALSLAPRDATLYGKRSAVYRRIGKIGLAEQDRQCAAALVAYNEPRNRETIDIVFGDGLRIDTPASALAWGAGAWLALAVVYCFVGYRQSREGGGTIRRLIGVAAGTAFIALLPLFFWLAVQSFHSPDPLAATRSLLLTALSGLWMALTLRPPHRPYGGRPPLPLVEDESLLARVATIAKSMGISPPRVRMLRSVGGAQRVLAWAGGLPQPIIIVTDGLLYRLDETERDAVIAHEMAHIANHSLWPLSSLFSISCAVAALVAIWYPLGVAMAFGFALLIGLRRIISRPIEADCDRRAGRAIGFSNTVSALTKIHALQPIRNTGWMSLVGYALATHPSREVRLSLLRGAAQREEADGSMIPPASEVNGRAPSAAESDDPERRFRLHRAVSWLGVILWIGSLCLGLRLASVSENVAFWLLISVPCIPILLLSFARTAATRRASARQRIGPAWLGFLIVLAVLALIYSPFFIEAVLGPNQLGAAILTPLVMVGVLTAILASSRRGQGVRRQIAEAMQDHRFNEILEIGRKNRKLIATRPLDRYNLALIEALKGDRAVAIAEFQEMRTKYRRFALPALTLAVLHYDDGNLEAAVEIAREAALRWPKDPEFRLCEAKALRRLGRLDEAQAAVDAAIAIDQGAGSAYAIAAGIALDRGDLSAARRLNDRAKELEPGGLLMLVIEAEIALSNGNRDEARAAIDRAVKTIKSNPFALCDADIVRLEQRFAPLDAEKIAG